MYMANRIAVIRDGQLLQNDVPDEVFSPQGSLCCCYFGEPNRVKGRVTMAWLIHRLAGLRLRNLQKGLSLMC